MNAVLEQYEYRKDPLIVLPYSPNVGAYPEQALVVVYERLKAEGLFEIVFHDNPNLTLANFLSFFAVPRNLLQIVGVIAEDQVVDTAGLAWLSDVVECHGGLTRAMVNYCAFRAFQRPEYTDPFAELLLSYWFGALGIDTLCGMTPSDNRAAVLYLKRVGFKEAGRIPNFTTLHGKVCDGVISYMSRDDWGE